MAVCCGHGLVPPCGADAMHPARQGKAERNSPGAKRSALQGLKLGAAALPGWHLRRGPSEGRETAPAAGIPEPGGRRDRRSDPMARDATAYL